MMQITLGRQYNPSAIFNGIVLFKKTMGWGHISPLDKENLSLDAEIEYGNEVESENVHLRELNNEITQKWKIEPVIY
jgi:hypothetical protein